MQILRTLASAAVFACAAAGYSITLGQVDDFEDGTTMNWGGGALPTNMLGGPGGAGDHYLSITAGGVGGGRFLATYNTIQWAGDYQAAGVKVIEADVRNEGPDDVDLRLVMFAPLGSRFCSATPIHITAGSGWRRVQFPLGASYFTEVLGNESYADLIVNVQRLMFRHNPTAIPGGSSVTATLGLDNVTASAFATARPENFSFLRGILLSGGLSDLFFSDDMRIVCRPGVVLSSTEAPVQLQVISTAPFLGASELHFLVESSVNQVNLTQRMLAFNYTTSQFVQIDSHQASLTDSTTEVNISSPSQYIDVNGQVKALITFKASGPILSYPWQARIDQAIWKLVP